MIIRRILGLIILLTALVIFGGSIYAAYTVGDALADLGAGIRDNLALAPGGASPPGTLHPALAQALQAAQRPGSEGQRLAGHAG